MSTVTQNGGPAEVCLHPQNTGEMASAAQPQLVDGQAWWPEHWGLNREQIRALLDRLRGDLRWKRQNSVYTLVKDFIIPWTKGSGIGYALAANRSSPLEVNLMISHSWGENAEDFLEALLRSTTADDVMFVCALSLYQAADISGPSIAAQIGTISLESPFRRVLEHIRGHGYDSGPSWRWRPLLVSAPATFLFMAVCFFYLPILLWECVPGLMHCARSELVWTSTKIGIDWVWVDLGPTFRIFPAAALCCLACAVASAVGLRCARPYVGRMLVVPNRECDIYERLWCVYEIFTAARLGVDVSAARTLAAAGASQAASARCSCESDELRIRSEIRDEGHSFAQIDRAVSLMLMRRFWSIVRVCLISACLLSMCMMETLVSSGFPLKRRNWAVVSTLLASGSVVGIVYSACRWNQGVVTRRLMCVVSFGLVAAGSAATIFLSPEQELWFAISAGASPIFTTSGIALLVLSIGSHCRIRCCPALEIVMITLAIWILHDKLLVQLLNFLWARLRHYPTPSLFTHWIPSSITTCPIFAHPYPCSVRILANLMESVIPAYTFRNVAITWGIGAASEAFTQRCVQHARPQRRDSAKEVKSEGENEIPAEP